MDENREQIPADAQEKSIEPVQEPVSEQAAEAQKLFDADAAKKQAQPDVYKWDYEHQRVADKKRSKPGRGGVALWIYALLVTAACALCLGLVCGLLAYAVIDKAQGSDEVPQGGLGGNVTVVGGGDEQTIELSALESVRNYTVVISAQGDSGVNTGTGFVLTEDGYIATNYHVVEGASTITVKFYNKTAAVAQLVGYSEIDDIAVIKIQARGLYTARIGSSAAVKDAQNVYAVGTPAGEEYAWSVTKGIVSFAQREVKIYDDEGILVKKMQLIQTDTPVNPGNSGGPLVNSDGEVLGIITLKLSGQYENMGFAIPIDGAMVLIQNIIETGEPGESPITSKRPMLGVVGVGVEAGVSYVMFEDHISSDPADLLKYADRVFTASHTGILVTGLVPGLDAEKKLQPGDIIVLADGKELRTIYDLMDVVNEYYGGDTVQLVYYRNGVANTVDIVLGHAD